jgi:hypothetical protein
VKVFNALLAQKRLLPYSTAGYASNPADKRKIAKQREMATLFSFIFLFHKPLRINELRAGGGRGRVSPLELVTYDFSFFCIGGGPRDFF